MTLVTEGFGPYRVPFWNELATHCELTVILFGRVEKGRAWRVDLDAVRCRVLQLESRQIFIKQIDWALYLAYGSVRRAISQSAPDVVVIGGWASPGYWAARSWAMKFKVPMVFWSESHVLSTRTLRVPVFNKIKSRFLSPFGAYYAFSPLSAEYLLGFGVEEKAVFLSYNLPDIGAFRRCDRIGVSRVPVFVFVGQLIERKGLYQLFDALGRVTDLAWKLIIAGTGPLKENLDRKANKLGFADRIQYLGFVQQEKMSDVYRQADILLFPSLNEVWGLVLHEALLSGLFAIASNRAASTYALVKNGENGEVVSPHDIDGIAAALRISLKRMPFDRTAIRRTIEHITLENEVAKLVAAAKFAQAAHTGASSQGN